jgi:lysophospholipid acyltransferase (LPLAT)-like uncharacterized protein
MTGLGTLWKRLQGNLLFLYIRLVALTSRLQIDGKENLNLARASGRPLFFCSWHGQQMLSLLYGINFEDVASYAALVVGDERYHVLNTMLTRLGVKSYSVDMQGNPVAAGRSVLRLIQAMRRGMNSGILPDGPDGPAFVPKPGLVLIARKAAATIMPMGAWTRHAYQLRRWDRYLVPFPFARIHVVFGKPLRVPPDEDKETLLARLTKAMNDASLDAQLSAGIRPGG